MAEEQLAFAWGREPEPPAPSARMTGLARRLRALAERGVWLGTSSWKYPGWLGSVYDAERYTARGRFSKRKFNDTCLAEYAGIFPTVCGDFTFYQFPSPDLWRQTFAQVPDGFRFSLKVPEDVTVERFPDLPRYGRRTGQHNPHFLDAGLVRDQLLAPLEPYRDRLGVLIFQFGTIRDGPLTGPDAFADALGRMLSRLPADRFRFAVEVRNRAYLERPGRYLGVLRTHGVAHCLSSWTRMPSPAEQMRIPDIFTATHAVARLLLRPGRTYQQAVEQFAPYERIRDPYPEGRAALRELIDASLSGDNALYAFVNNRFEGNAVETIAESIEA